MNEEPVFVTPEGLTNMKAELKERTEVKRQEIAERLDAAIKMGDLKENADYHTAKEDQGFNEGRIQQLQDRILRAQIIEESSAKDRVRLGNTVTVAEVGFEDDEETYRIVGSTEADPVNGKISHKSPIGQALMGARPGQVVKAKTPNGLIEFKVVEIS